MAACQFKRRPLTTNCNILTHSTSFPLWNGLCQANAKKCHKYLNSKISFILEEIPQKMKDNTWHDGFILTFYTTYTHDNSKHESKNSVKDKIY